MAVVPLARPRPAPEVHAGRPGADPRPLLDLDGGPPGRAAHVPLPLLPPSVAPRPARSGWWRPGGDPCGRCRPLV